MRVAKQSGNAPAIQKFGHEKPPAGYSPQYEVSQCIPCPKRSQSPHLLSRLNLNIFSCGCSKNFKLLEVLPYFVAHAQTTLQFVVFS